MFIQSTGAFMSVFFNNRELMIVGWNKFFGYEWPRSFACNYREMAAKCCSQWCFLNWVTHRWFKERTMSFKINCRLKKSPLFHSKESFLVSTHYPQIQYDFYSSRIANQHYRVEDTRKAVSQINSMKLQRNEIYKLVESIFTNWVELLNNNVLTKTNDIVQD